MRKLLTFILLMLASPSLAQLASVPPINDADRYQSYNISVATTSIGVTFPVFGDCTDLLVKVNGSPLSNTLWTCSSVSGVALNQQALPITDMQVTFTPPLTTGFVEILGGYHPRWLTMPTQPGITRREFNQTVGALVAGLREAYHNLNALALYSYSGAWSSALTYTVNQIVTYSGTTYISIQGANTNNNPSTSPTWWSIFASGGPPGPTGPAGPTGATGPAGTNGTNGTGSGTVTSVATGAGLTGGPVTVTGTIAQAITVNAQSSTTYTFLTGDQAKLVTFTNAGAIAGTLPQATGGFAAGWFVDVENRGAGTLTITPTVSTIDGASSYVLTTNQGVRLVSDGTNYYTQRGSPTVAGATAVALCGTSGLVIKNNAGTPLTKMDITADQVVMLNGSNSPIFASAVSVTVDTTTTGAANGMDTGSRPTSGWAYYYLISNGSTTAGLASTSAASPTLPGGYTYKCRVGAGYFNGAQNSLQFIQRGNRQQYTTFVAGIASGANGLAAAVPPTATVAFITVYNSAVNSSTAAVSSDGGQLTYFTNPVDSTNYNEFFNTEVLLESAQTATFSASGGYYLTGYIDRGAMN